MATKASCFVMHHNRPGKRDGTTVSITTCKTSCMEQQSISRQAKQAARNSSLYHNRPGKMNDTANSTIYQASRTDKP
ncbi:hypothetical protein PoB_003111700 [Plakobranchus ocellatus]|uniref:Uncharacterized protein n=1 Tax=Plakobranchus ocellatus TaxID=259542 RepID=A0AAV4ABI2_9GAST|nr:hypothetical protein PoB_003111700 [Plakobranchus ocellatus]